MFRSTRRIISHGRVLGKSVPKRAFSMPVQPPQSLGPGGRAGEVPSDYDQATGAEREELKAFAMGREYYDRFPVQMEPGDGTFENPVMVGTLMESRVLGIVPKGQDMPVWFEIKMGEVYYVPWVDLHFKLFKAPHPLEPDNDQESTPAPEGDKPASSA